MVKILGRILIILLATGLVIGATYAISLNTSLSTPGGPGGSGLSQAMPERSQGSPAQLPGGGELRGGRGGEGEGGSAFGWMEVLKSLGRIGGVAAVVILIQKAYQGVRRIRKGRAAASLIE